MSQSKTISSALISVFSKNGLEPIVKKLKAQGVTIYSTGGTQKFINDLGIEVVAVEAVTDYPAFLGSAATRSSSAAAVRSLALALLLRRRAGAFLVSAFDLTSRS